MITDRKMKYIFKFGSKGNAEIILAIIVAVALGAFVAIFAIRNIVPPDTVFPVPPEVSEPSANPRPLSPLPIFPNSPSSETFKNAYATGFEGVYFRVDYSLRYDPRLFAVHVDENAAGKIYIVEKANNHTHSIKILNNDGPGFSSAKDFFTNTEKCYTCREVKNTFTLLDVIDIRTYIDASSTRTWIAYANPPGFILLSLVEPSDAVKVALKTLVVTSKKLERTTCDAQGSCKFGESCPLGTECSGEPSFGCYPLGCPYPQ
ncbi:MAG: hypothetical protein Q7S28_00060 [bacterium]|nr:hypothetical protein [bacterium]